MKKSIVIIAITLAALAAVKAQPATFEWQNQVKNIKATVKVLNNGELYVLVPDNNSSMRYISEQLPQEYKKDGLQVTFSGWEAKIPPYMRMMGKPLKLTCICVSKAEKKKYSLGKLKYTFKEAKK